MKYSSVWRTGFPSGTLFIFLALLLFFPTAHTDAATRIWDGGGGDSSMATAENWCDDTAPTTSDNIWFGGGDGGQTCDAGRTDDATWDTLGTGAWQNITLSATGTAYTGTVTFTQNHTHLDVVVNSGTLAMSNTGIVAARGGDFTVASGATVSQTAGTLRMGSSGNLGGAGSMTLNELHIDGAGTASGTTTLAGNVTVNGDCEIGIDSTTLDMVLDVNTRTLVCTGTLDINTQLAQAGPTSKLVVSTGTLQVDGAVTVSNQITGVGMPYAMLDGGSGTLVFGSTLDVSSITDNDFGAVDNLIIFRGGTNLTVAGATTVTQSGNASANDNDIEFNLSGTAAELFGGLTLELEGATPNSVLFTPGNSNDINGTLTFQDSSTAASGSTVDWIDPGSAYTVNASTTVTITDNGSSAAFNFNTNNSTFTFDGNADQVITIPSGFYFANVTVNNEGTAGSDDVYIEGGNLEVNGTLTITDGELNLQDSNESGSYSLTQNGDFTVGASGSWVRGGTSTVTIGATGTFTDNAGNFDLGDITIASTTAATVTLGSSATSSSVTIAAGETLNLGSSSYSLYLTTATGSSTPLTIKGTFTPGTSVTVFKATSTITVPSTVYSSVTFDDRGDSSTMTLGGNLNASSTITITGGNLDVSASDYEIFVDGNWTNNDTFTARSGTTTFTGTTGTKTITTNGSKFHGLTFDDDANSATYQLQDQLNASSTVLITDGTVDANGQTMVLGLDFTISDTFTHNSNTTKFAGTGDQTVTTGGTTFNNLTIDNDGASGTDNIIISGALDIDGTLTITDGDLDTNTNDPNVTLAGDFTVGSAGSWDRGSGTFTFDGSSTQTYTDNSSSHALGDVLVSGTTNTLALGSSATSSYMHVHTGETLSLGANTLYLNNGAGTTTPLDVDGTFTPGTGTVSYKSSANSTIDPVIYYNLTTNADGIAFTVSASTTAKNALTNTRGTIRVNGQLNNSGTLTNSDTIIEGTSFVANTASLSLDATSYTTGDTLTITLTDADENLVGTTTQTATTSVTLTTGSDEETVTVTETGAATGIFTATLATANASASSEDGTLQVSADDTITIAYTDSEHHADNAASDTASLSIPAASSSDSGSSGGGGGGSPSIITAFGGSAGSGSGLPQQVTIIPPQVIPPTLPPPLPPTVPGGIVDFIGGIVSPTPNVPTSPSIPSVVETFAEFPERFQLLVRKFPDFAETLKKVGISALEDIERLSNIRFKLPTFAELDDIPNEVVFARSGNNLIDFNITLIVDEEGNPEQQISTVSGETLNLAVRPQADAASVTGHLVLKEGRGRAAVVPLDFQLASVLFSGDGAPTKEVAVEVIDDELLIQSFDYGDPDRDGIYTAEIVSPEVQGEYEILTIIDYIDPELGKRQIRFTLLVDPEGYIFEKIGREELRLTDAVVSIFVQDSDTGEFVLWPANEFNQINPQRTDNTGEYAFLVPPGTYRLTVEKEGYGIHEGAPFPVIAGRGVHQNIELIPNITASRLLTSPIAIGALLIALVILVIIILSRRGRGTSSV